GAPIPGERASRQDPAAHEVAAGLLGPALVDRAAAVAAEMARHAGLHLVALDHAGHPPVATRGALPAGARGLRCDRDHRAMALLVLASAPARARIVAPDRHRRSPHE